MKQLVSLWLKAQKDASKSAGLFEAKSKECDLAMIYQPNKTSPSSSGKTISSVQSAMQIATSHHAMIHSRHPA
ncbi:MAG: hypothetical protein ACRCRW_04130 [Aeromonadaceae bacterium]